MLAALLVWFEECDEAQDGESEVDGEKSTEKHQLEPFLHHQLFNELQLDGSYYHKESKREDGPQLVACRAELIRAPGHTRIYQKYGKDDSHNGALFGVLQSHVCAVGVLFLNYNYYKS